MLAVELKAVLSLVIRPFFVSEQVSVRSDLSNNWSISEDLSLDALSLERDAVVADLVDLVLNSALVVI